MPRYADSAKEQVRDAVDMVDLVGTRTELRRQGGPNYMGRCPFHEERTASFSVDADRKLYHCFGCGVGGDAFSFVQELEGFGFVEAMEWLAQRYGVELEVADEDPRAAERRRRQERLHELLERAAAFYARHLWESPEAEAAREHLRSRGLDESVLREFRVGWAPGGGGVLTGAAQKLGFSFQDLTESGLMRRDRRDFFQRRITFPLCDLRGRVLGFGARTLDPAEKAKYVNTPDGEVFHKRRVVFAADIARRPAAQSGSVVLAEGYTDVIALHQAGVRSAVATMGTALADEQVGVLARMAPVLVLALDADRAGQDAMVKAHEAAAGKLEVRVAPLPAGQDPADLLLASGPDALRAVVQETVPFVRFRVGIELDRGDLRSGEGKDRVLAVVAPLLAQVGPVERDELVRMIAGRMQVGEHVVQAQIPGSGNGQARGVASRPARPGAGAPDQRRTRRELDPSGRAEKAFLMACLALPSEGAAALAQVPDDAFTADLVRRAAAHLRANLEDPSAGLGDDDPQLRSLVAGLVLGAGRLQGVTPAAVRGQLANVRLAHLDRRIAAARASGSGGIAAMVAERAAIRTEIDDGITAILDATRAPEL